MVKCRKCSNKFVHKSNRNPWNINFTLRLSKQKNGKNNNNKKKTHKNNKHPMIPKLLGHTFFSFSCCFESCFTIPLYAKYFLVSLATTRCPDAMDLIKKKTPSLTPSLTVIVRGKILYFAPNCPPDRNNFESRCHILFQKRSLSPGNLFKQAPLVFS